jgi:hypothetical protein
LATRKRPSQCADNDIAHLSPSHSSFCGSYVCAHLSAEAAGVRVGDIILQVDGRDVNPMRDVRELLVNNNPEVSLVVQAESSQLAGGPWGFVGMGSLRSSGQPRNVTIKRHRPASMSGGSPACAHRSPNVDAAQLPPRAQAARERGRSLFREGLWKDAACAFSEVY